MLSYLGKQLMGGFKAPLALMCGLCTPITCTKELPRNQSGETAIRARSAPGGGAGEPCDYPYFMDGRSCLFTGGEMRDNVHLVSGLEFRAVDRVSIHYRVSFPRDWENVREISNTAALSLVDGDTCQAVLEDSADGLRAAYRLVDNSRSAPLVILVEKTDHRNTSKVRVLEQRAGGAFPLTPVLYAK